MVPPPHSIILVFKTHNKIFDYASCPIIYGMTFCLRKAAMDLVNTKESITSIAQNLQFSNRTHFYPLFEKQYHMTPKDYRAAHTLS